MEPRRELRVSPELRQSSAELGERFLRRVLRVFGVRKQMGCEALHLRRMALAERLQRPVVAVSGTPDQDGITELLVDERPLASQRLVNVTACASPRLHPRESTSGVSASRVSLHR
jgi:hypothetical protein